MVPPKRARRIALLVAGVAPLLALSFPARSGRGLWPALALQTLAGNDRDATRDATGEDQTERRLPKLSEGVGLDVLRAAGVIELSGRRSLHILDRAHLTALAEAGHDVRAMTRNPDEYAGPARPVAGDVADAGSLADAVRIFALAEGKSVPGILSKKRRTNSWRKTEMPIAVISGASRGAWRSGR